MKYLALTLLIAVGALVATAQDYTKWVNPFIGTGGHGHTFPGATMPFGMVQLSPDTRIDNWDGSSGYHYSDDTIYGFSHTHLSGTGIPDGCDILLMPSNGDFMFGRPEDNITAGYPSKFSHANEKAEPGYYSVKLDDDNIFAELTATTRVGFHRYTFPKTAKANVTLDLGWRDKVLDSGFKLVGPRRIEGFRTSSSWAKKQTVYFVAEFSTDFDKASPTYFTMGQIRSATHADTLDARIALRVAPPASGQVLAKVAISFVSIEGARKNLAAELPGWDFDKVRSDAKAAWNKELSKIAVSGGTDAQTTNFYTALYHTMIQPNVFSDVDGSYRGHDGKVHSLRSADTPVRMSAASARKSPSVGKADKSVGAPSEQYTVFSLWDTFRAAHPLYTIIDERRTVDFINTFIRQYEQGGRLPVWELWGEETDTMIGYHAVSVIADAMAKGIKGFDYEKAYAAAKHSAELDHFGLKDYKRRGYISMEDEHESVSKTLEYAYNDWCIAQMAAVLGGKPFVEFEDGDVKTKVRDPKYSSDYVRYSTRAASYRNIFDKKTGFMRPKKNGDWLSPFAPNEVTFNYTEGNAWQYTFFVPHDVHGLIELYGGKSKFAAKLDEFFTTDQKLAGREQPDITGLIGQYAHGNEPSHHIAYLYNYAERPWKTQKYVRQIMDEFYKPTPDGLIGNEDCGQMSAWYIFSAMGFYPVAPGETKYEVGSPIFKKVKINLENGKTFRIVAPEASANNIYVKDWNVNGKRGIWATGFDHKEMIDGGVLKFEMASKPTPFPSRGGFLHGPRSWSGSYVAVPIISATQPAFSKETEVSIIADRKIDEIYYTTDGSEPTKLSSKFSVPFKLTENTVIRAIAIRNSGAKSLVSEAKFVKKPNEWTVKIEHKYNRQYTGGGDEGLIDGIRGTINFASGEWQGYQPKDLIATIDLQRETTISELGGGFLQNARSWIWMPTRIVFETSMDGVTFTKAAEIKTDIAPTDMKEQIKDYVTKIAPTKARYVRVHAYNLGKIPAWHPGAGDDTFIFVDEILIR